MRHYAQLGLLASVVALSSCFDKSYDINNVDWKVATNADLTLPVCSTDSILLRNFMDLKEKGVIKLVHLGHGESANAGDSIFVVDQSDSIAPQTINVGDVTIAKPTIETISKTATLSSNGFKIKAKSPRRVNVNVGGKTITINDDFTYIIPSSAQTSISSVARDISADLVAIKSVEVQDNVVSIHIATSFDTGYTFIKKLHLDGITLSLPEDIHVKSCTIGDASHTQNAVSIATGKIQLTSDNDADGFDMNGIDIQFTLDGINEGNNFVYHPSTHTADINGTFQLGGVFRLHTADIESLESIIASMSDADKLKILGGDITPLIPTKIDFTASTNFSDDIRATHFTGSVEHAISNINPVKLKDVPDFLNDSATFIDLDNPMLILTAHSAFSGDATTSFKLKSNTYADTIRTGSITMKGNNVKNNYYLANKQDQQEYYLPQEYTGATYISTPNFGKLINRLPDSISIAVSPVSMQCNNLTLGQQYSLHVNYKFYAPLVFGSQFYLRYLKTEKDWDLGDASKLDGDSIVLTADVTTNKIDSRFTFTILPVDKDGNEIKTLQVNSVSVPAQSDESATPYTIRLTVKPTAGHTLHDALAEGDHQLNGIKYSAILDQPASSARSLTNKSYIKLKNIKLTLKGQVTYDAN